ncbi:MAG: NAD/NADP octopine/nopaline dehydrogenase family protein, partial [Chloroflexi bacterium]|nr:NAD/NADP octopine/nopaline dehydrogenase family protein [Chloroflexota bacterium]
PNTLYTGLQNMNAMLHVANVVSNIGRIESGQVYRFYAEGYTPAVARLLGAADAERLAVGRAYGVSAVSVPDWIDRTYGFREATLSETFARLTNDVERGPYQWTPTPRSLGHNYVAEDVPCGLVPMSELGRAASVPTPVIDGLISTASALAGRDFRAEGRTLERLGLAGKDIATVLEIVRHGFSA